MEWKPNLFVTLLSCVIFNTDAGVMREDVSVQDYRDFAENRGKYTPGAENIEVFKTDGTSAGFLNFPMPDFSASDDSAVATLISPSHIVSVAHNGGYGGVKYGNGAKYSFGYKIISRNVDPSGKDFHTPRLNKVVTDVAPSPIVLANDARKDHERYKYFSRVGSGTQYQIVAATQTYKRLAGAYVWKSGGTIVNPTFENWRLRWTDYGPKDPRVQPFSSAGQAGDSGSPLFVYDSLEKQWKLYGVLTSGSDYGVYNLTTYVLDLQTTFIQSIIAATTDPDVTDAKTDGDIHWGKLAITQGDAQWQWHGVNYALPTQASNDELNTTKDLRFNGEGGLIVLDSSVNHGAAKLQFSNDYRVISAEGENATWVGGGVEVDAGKTVDWEINGLKGDALHKIGEGTLYVNATGVNGGDLRAGDGTVILAQQADKNNQRQAFSTVTLVSGRPIVQLGDEGQITGDQIQFGSRGGLLDLNGYDLSFTTINHNDSGAIIANTNDAQPSLITLKNTAAQTFLGHLGSAAHPDSLDIDYAPVGNQSWNFAGGADVNTMTLRGGTALFSGQATPHAGGVVFKDDWISENYHINNLQVENGAHFVLNEHASLSGSVTLAESTEVVLTGKTHFTGDIQLNELAKLVVINDPATLASTDGNADNWLNGNVAGEGSAEKYGSDTLFWRGENTLTGGVDIYGGTLNLAGSVNSDVKMYSNTALVGNARVQNLTLGDNVTLRPYDDSNSGLLKAGSFAATSQVINGNLVAGNNTQLYLRSQMDEQQRASDTLLIAGNVDTANDPVTIHVDLSGDGYMTDVNDSGIAGPTEGISLVQVGGTSSKNSFQLEHGYVAHGPWQYSLFAFAPGKSDGAGRQVSGTGDQYWDYRLETSYLTEGDEPKVDPDPTPDEPVVIPDPDPTPDEPVVIPDPDPTPDEPVVIPDPTPTPDDGTPASPVTPVQPGRLAVIPQVPSYLSLPSALLSYNSRINQTFHNLAQTPSMEGKESERYPLWLQYINGEDKYHTSLSFSDYGSDYTQKEQGWLLGGKVMHLGDDEQYLAWNVAISNADLKVTPDAKDGNSEGNYTTYGLTSLLTFRHQSGWTFDLGADITKYDGDVSTDARGKVADIDATSWSGTLETSYPFVFGESEIAPVLGAGVQVLNVDDFTDTDGTAVRYGHIVRPTGQVGLRYRYNLRNSAVGNMMFYTNTYLTKDFSNTPEVWIGSARNHDVSSTFDMGKAGSSASIDAGIISEITPLVSVNAGIQYQQRLSSDDEGISAWQGNVGMRITF